MEGELLAAQIEKLLQCADPSVTMLSGSPGIGKSHTLRELRNFYMSKLPLLYVEAVSLEREPLSVWVPLVRMLIASHLETPVEQLSRAAIRALLPDGRAAVDADRVTILLEGRSTRAAQRNLAAEIEIVSSLLCQLMTVPHALLLDGLERLSEAAWQVLAAV